MARRFAVNNFSSLFPGLPSGRFPVMRGKRGEGDEALIHMLFPVTSKKNDSLQRAMERLGIRDADLEESFIRSGGPGGQNGKKVATCVVLKHIPTGLEVKCQTSRSQAMNRYAARRILIKKLEAQIHGQKSAEARRIAKIKRQKRKRSKRAKDKMLAGKKQHSEKKQRRQRVSHEE